MCILNRDSNIEVINVGRYQGKSTITLCLCFQLSSVGPMSMIIDFCEPMCSLGDHSTKCRQVALVRVPIKKIPDLVYFTPLQCHRLLQICKLAKSLMQVTECHFHECLLALR